MESGYPVHFRPTPVWRDLDLEPGPRLQVHKIAGETLLGGPSDFHGNSDIRCSGQRGLLCERVGVRLGDKIEDITSRRMRGERRRLRIDRERG